MSLIHIKEETLLAPSAPWARPIKHIINCKAQSPDQELLSTLYYGRIGAPLWPRVKLGSKELPGAGLFPVSDPGKIISLPRRNLLDSVPFLRDFLHDQLINRAPDQRLASHALPPDQRGPGQLPLGTSGLMFVRQSYVERRGHGADGGGGGIRPSFNIFSCQPSWGSLKTEGRETRPWGRGRSSLVTDSSEFCIPAPPRRDEELEPGPGPRQEGLLRPRGVQSHRLFTNCLVCPLALSVLTTTQTGRQRALLLGRWGQRG